MPRPNPHAPVRRVIDTCLWRDPKVTALGNPRSSPLMLFIFLATHPNSGRIPGVLVESPQSIAAKLGWKLDTTRDMLQTLQESGLVFIDSTHWLVWIPNAIKYNNPSGAGEVKLWAREWRGVPACELKERIAKELGDFLAPRPLLAVAFAKHCLGQSVVAPPAPVVAAPEPKKKPAAKAAERKAQWETEFEELWPQYPKRAGGNPKADALRAYIVRRRDDKILFEDIKAGLTRYVAYCEATQKIGTEKVLQAATFFGPSKRFAEAYELPSGHAITVDLKTSPDFERVLAEFPRQDSKAEAWAAWQRIDPTPTAELADRMVASIAEWKKYQWTPGKESFTPTLAKWLESMGWNRKFKQNGGRASFEETAARFGAGMTHGNGNLYEGEVVAHATPVLDTPRKPSDAFDISTLPARR